MAFFETLAGIAVTVIAISLAMYVAYLALGMITEFIRNVRTTRFIRGKIVLVKEELENGNVQVFVGFMDGRAVKELQTYEARETDANIKKIPVKTPVSINEK
jgi:hypothetical protein